MSNPTTNVDKRATATDPIPRALGLASGAEILAFL